MSIKKVKLGNGSKVSINYFTQNGQGTFDEYQVKSTEKPIPEFFEAFKVLIPHISDICEIASKFRDRVGISGVSFKDGKMVTVVVSGVVLQDGFSIDFVLETNHEQEAFYSAADDKRFPRGYIPALNNIINECEEFIKGNRAQMQLFKVVA